MVSLTKAEALGRIRALDRSQVKLAELGGDGQDENFELSFSNLAHAYLRDSAPSLLDHEVGFQLLDRNQENSKAVGVFGFKVGTQYLFAPVFFLQGDLKGHELLYLKDQDLFVPLDEGWLNYILNRKPNILGESVDRQTSQLGVMQPDLNRLSKSPWKYASYLADVLPVFAHTALMNTSTELDKWAQELHLPTFCKEGANLAQLRWLVETCRCRPKIAQAIIQHHGSLDFISEGIQRARGQTKSASVLNEAPPQHPRVPAIIGGSVLDNRVEHPIKRGALKIITYEATIQTELPEGLDEEDAEKLLKDEVLIKDDRSDEEISTPYNVQVEQKLFNPQESGIYMVLTKPGEFEKSFVAFQPAGPNGRVGFCTIVRLSESDRNWLNVHPSHIWCCAKIEGEEYSDWYDGLKDPSSLPTDKSRHILIGPRGNATLPFQVEGTLGDAQGKPSYEVDFSDHADHQYSGNILMPSHERGSGYNSTVDSWNEPSHGYDKWRDGQRIHLDGKEGTKLRTSRGDVYVPKGYKILNLRPSAFDKAKATQDKNVPVYSSPNENGQSDPPPIRPGNLLDAELGIMTKVSAVEMQAIGRTMKIGATIYDEVGTLVHLVRDHGLAEAPARQVIKNAREHPSRPYTVHIKHADQYSGDPYLTNGGPSAPGFPDQNTGGSNPMGWPGPTQEQSEYALPVDMGETNNRAAYDVRPGSTPEPMDAGGAQAATQSGQQEVFDTAMIGSMLKAVRDDTMIDRYLPDLVKGLDRLGRILFQFYWNGDKFADRYGKTDMPELEDTLRSAFERTGEVILFLKQKTIEPYPEEDSVDAGLGDT